MAAARTSRAPLRIRAGVRCIAVLALVVLGQLSGAVHASSPQRPKAAGVYQRCKHRNHASGTVSVGMASSADPIFTEWQMRTDTLLTYDNRVRLVPEMADKVPTVKNGGIRDGARTVVFTLKKGLRWSNGAEVTSADIRFGWLVKLDPASDPADNCSSCSHIANITTPDRYTVVFRLKQPWPPLFDALANNDIAVWPPVWPKFWNHDPHQAAQEFSVDPNWTWVGPQYPTNGPYYLASLSDTGAVLHPMKYYSTLACGASVQTVKIELISTTAAILAEAAERRIDVIATQSPLQLIELPELRRHADVYRTHLDPSQFVEGLHLNVDATYQGQPNPLHDTNVRLALALALDKVGVLAQALQISRKDAAQHVAWTPWLSGTRFTEEGADRSITGQWDPLANGGRGDYVSQTGSGAALADAGKLLAKTRWSHGFSLDFYTTASNPMRQAEEEVIAANWKRIGVHLVPHFLPFQQLIERYDQGGVLARGDFQVFMIGDGALPPDDLALKLASKYRTRGAGSNASDPNAANVSGIHDPIIDRAFAEAAKTFSASARRRDFAAIQLELNRKAYWILLYPHLGIWTDDGRVQNITLSLPFSSIFWDTYAWKLKGR